MSHNLYIIYYFSSEHVRYVEDISSIGFKSKSFHGFLNPMVDLIWKYWRSWETAL